ncbi:MAG: aminotransferase class V-fold PLP-dependent enzyme [Candidatus Methanofastidiosia archaeon]
MKIRDEFEIHKHYNYLNTAATSPLPRYVIEEVEKFMKSRASFAEGAWDVWIEKINVARAVCASFIGANKREIAFLKNTGEGLNTVCAMLPARGNIVTTGLEFPSNYLPWKLKYKDVRIVKSHNGRFDIGDFEKAIDDDTLAVSISEITYNTGARLPTEEISQLAHDHDAYCVCDAIQAIGAVCVDVKKKNFDFVSCGCHKWLNSPFGVAIFYIREDLIDKFKPPYVGWFSLDDDGNYSLSNTRLSKTAKRFEIGNLNFSGIFGLSTSVQVMMNYGIDKIEDEVTLLASYLMDKLQEKGKHIITPREDHGGIVVVEDRAPCDTVRRLLKKRIVVASRNGVRVSPHFWNTKQELDELIDEI